MAHSAVDLSESIGTALLVWLLGAGMALAGFPTSYTADDTSGLTIRAESARVGHLFTDSEEVEVAAVVEGASGTTVVRFGVEEIDGLWRQTGEFALTPDARGKVTNVLPLDFPGRGLYRLSLTAGCEGTTASAETWIAIVFTPDEPDPASGWGIFWIPFGDEPFALAESIRRLGASWVRFNFWARSFSEITVTDGANPKIEADYSAWKRHAQALHERGLFLMGEIAQCPQVLSSQPDAVIRESGLYYAWSRVKPRNYGLWDQLMENVAHDFADEIDVWEIWNEPNLGFWRGTVEEYAELVAHTSAALRKGNPDTRIAAGGFAKGFDFADKLFQLGLGKHIDILTVHYTNEKPKDITHWKELLEKHNLDRPIWNSEERTEVPLRNKAYGIEKTFKFLHVAIDFPDQRPLVRRDLTVLPAGVAFSVGAHCIGTAQHVGISDKIPQVEAHFFKRGQETIAVFQRMPVKNGDVLFISRPASVDLAIEPLQGRDVTVTDTLGRSEVIHSVDGLVSLPLGKLFQDSSSVPGMLIINGARSIEIVDTTTTHNPEGIVLVEAESGEWHTGWQESRKEEFFGGQVLQIWADKEPGTEGYWVQVPFELARGGRYEVIFSGNRLIDRLKHPWSLSPFAWRFDDGSEHTVDDGLSVPGGFLGSLEAMSLLGTVELDAGKHVFHLCLTDRRETPDMHYTLWFDAILLRGKANGKD